MNCPLCKQSDVHWDATRYVLGELGDAERAAFETHMEVCQHAREATARAVELLDTLWTIGPGSGVGPTAAPPDERPLFVTGSPTLAGVFSLALVAVLLLVIGWMTRRTFAPDAGMREVALRWVSIQELAKEDPALFGGALWGEGDADEPAGVLCGAGEHEDSIATAVESEPVPDWVLAAVQAMDTEPVRQ